MKLFLLVFSILFIPFLAPASSTQIKVTKVKGKMALVEFEGPLTAGQNYSIVSSDVGATELKMGPRKYRFGFTFYFSSLFLKSSFLPLDSSSIFLNSFKAVVTKPNIETKKHTPTVAKNNQGSLLNF